MLKKILLGFVIAIGSIVLLILLAGFALGFYSMKVNSRMDAAGKKFCSAIHPGMTIETVIKRAERNDEKPRLGEHEGTYRFMFHGAMFHSAICEVQTLDGKVEKAEFEIYDD